MEGVCTLIYLGKEEKEMVGAGDFGKEKFGGNRT
jgi:hypothetical protein